MTKKRCYRCPNLAQRRGLCSKHYDHLRHQHAAAGITPYVDAAAVRAHVNALHAAGMSFKQIGIAAGVGETVVLTIHHRRHPTVRTATHTAIMAIPVPAATFTAVTDGARVDPTGTHRRLRALVSIGYTQRYLGQRLGMTEGNFGVIILGHRPFVLADTARRVEQLYAELQERRPANPSTKAIRNADRKGWAPPIAWDDDTIDDPKAKPQHDIRRRVTFPERFVEVRDHLGIKDIDEIAKVMKIDPHSVRDQIRRYREDLAS